NGQATFTNLSIQLAGNNYVIQATTGQASVLSTNFNILPAPGTQLVFSQMPFDPQYFGISFWPVPTVQIQDPYGNTCSSNGDIITISAAPGTTLLLYGNQSVVGAYGAVGTPAADGVAIFDMLTAFGASQQAQLVVSCPGLPSATSSAFPFL